MRNSFRLTIVLMIFVLFTLALFGGCAKMQGDLYGNQKPQVDFINVHDSSATIVYDYAPVIQWAGSDPDGFVQYYSYADITDSAAILDPSGYMAQIPDEVWQDTIATQARIYLLSESGVVTQHIFYIRCVDNEGLISDVRYKRFFRSNRPPDVPTIGLAGEDESLYDVRRVLTSDTLFSAPEITATYPGISFSWRGSDPDDKSLFKIPLQFQSILVKSPSDTIFVTNWGDNTDITLTDLETGNYTLNVWARDDGYTRSVNPARVEFYVIKPTFEHNLLVVMEETNTAANVSETPNVDSLTTFYHRLLSDVAPHLSNVELNVDDGIDVKFLLVDNLGTATQPKVPSRYLLSQYKMVIFATDQFKIGAFTPTQYREKKAQLLNDYLQVGGRVWMTGRMLGNGALAISQDADTQELLLQYFGISDVIAPQLGWIRDAQKAFAECIGTRNAVQSFPALQFDESKGLENWFLGYIDNSDGISGVERIERSEVAQTTQYLLSNTSGDTISVDSEDSEIQQEVTIRGVNFNYPPTSTTCYIMTDHNNVIRVDRVVNTTLRDAGASNYAGEVVVTNNNLVLVSYDEGQPWNNDDVLEVDYIYDPISDFHLKPCEVRYEGIQSNLAFSELRFRTAFTTFSYYFMDYEGTKNAWELMLDWFYNPNLNSASIIINP